MKNIAAVLMALAAFVCMAQSQPPTQAPAKASQSIQQATPSKNQNSNKDKRGTKDSPLVVDVVPAPDAQIRADEERENREKETAINYGIRNFTGWLVIGTFLLGAIAIWQGYLIHQQIKLARREFISSHRPRLAIKDLNFKPHINSSSPFAPGKATQIEYAIVNLGDTSGEIINGGATTLVTSSNIFPARTPISDQTKDFKDMKLACGQACKFDVTSRIVPNNAQEIEELNTGAKRIYYYGAFEYVDDLGFNRRTGFCRLYNPVSGFFEKVDAPDYEYEE